MKTDNQLQLFNEEVRNPGWWLNFKTNKFFEVDEHKRWLQKDSNLTKLVPGAKLPPPDENRDRYMVKVLNMFPIVRIRKRDIMFAFEFSNEKNKNDVTEAAFKFLSNVDQYPGPASHIEFHALHPVTGVVVKWTALSWREFQQFGEDEEWQKVWTKDDLIESFDQQIPKLKNFEKLMMLAEEDSAPLLAQSIEDQGKGPYTPGLNPSTVGKRKSKKKKIMFARKVKNAL